jgi:ADP-ribosylglycohydrolase
MSRTEPADPSFSGRVRALIHGVALGDAMGAPVEKLSAGEIRRRYGRINSLNNEWHRNSQEPAARNGRVRGHGIVTDDTLMTLSLIAVYNEVGRNLDAWDMADGMVRQIAWTERWVPELQRECALIERLFYPEKWIFQRHQLASCDPRQGGVGNMVNCGAAMYMAPVGVINACDPEGAYNEAIRFASGHQQSYGLEAAGVLAAAVAAAFVPETDIGAIVEAALGVARDGTRAAIYEIASAAEKLRHKGADSEEVVARFHQTISRFSPIGDNLTHTADRAGIATPNYQPSRFHSIEELPLALGFAMVADGAFRPAIEAGVNSGRDTDSIGVMTGAILGALHGDGVIDMQEAKTLDEVNRLDLGAEAKTFTATALAIMAKGRQHAEKVAGRRVGLFEGPEIAAKNIKAVGAS